MATERALLIIDVSLGVGEKGVVAHFLRELFS